MEQNAVLLFNPELDEQGSRTVGKPSSVGLEHVRPCKKGLPPQNVTQEALSCALVVEGNTRAIRQQATHAHSTNSVAVWWRLRCFRRSSGKFKEVKWMNCNEIGQSSFSLCFSGEWITSLKFAFAMKGNDSLLDKGTKLRKGILCGKTSGKSSSIFPRAYISPSALDPANTFCKVS